MTRIEPNTDNAKVAHVHARALYIILLILTLAVFARVCTFQFLNWDDIDMLTSNPRFHPATFESLKQFFSGAYLRLYAPLSYAIWWVLVKLQGNQLHPGVFHALNLLLHVGSAAVVFSILRRCVRSDISAFLGALLFALHPLQVESIAWVAEENNLLAGALSLAAIRMYLAMADAPKEKQSLWFVLATSVYLLALYAKPTAVVVPLIAGLMDWGIVRRPIKIIAPIILIWLGISAVFCFIASNSQGGPMTPDQYRPLIAIYSLAFYLGKIFWPSSLTIDYCRTPQFILQDGHWHVACIAIIAVTIVAASLWRKWPMLWIGLAVMTAALLPVLGLTPFAFQRYSTVADRYIYLAMLGPALVMADGLARVSWPAITPAAIFVLIVLAFGSFVRSDDWQDTQHLTHATLLVDKQNAAGNFIQASNLVQTNQWEESLAYYRIALKRLPDDGGVHFSYGNALMRCGKFPDAIAEFETAFPLLDGDYEKQSNDLGNQAYAYIALKQPEKAAVLLHRALELNPENSQVNYMLNQIQKLRTTTEK